MKYTIQRRFQNDIRRWENIPKEILYFEDNKDWDIKSIMDKVYGYIIIYNRMEVTNGLKLQEIRLSDIDGFQGYYLVDWDFVKFEKETV